MHGSLHSSYDESIEIGTDSQNKKISRNLLLGIIKPRYEEILEIIRDNLFDNLHARIGINNIVLTGGHIKFMDWNLFHINFLIEIVELVKLKMDL